MLPLLWPCVVGRSSGEHICGYGSRATIAVPDHGGEIMVGWPKKTVNSDYNSPTSQG